MNAKEAMQLTIDSQIKYIENKILEACKEGKSSVEITLSGTFLYSETKKYLDNNGYKYKYYDNASSMYLQPSLHITW